MQKEIIRKSHVYLTCPTKPGRDLSFLDKNMGKFTREFNEKVKDKSGECVKVEIKIFQDKSYEFKVKNTPLIYKLRNRVINYPQLDKKEQKEVRRKERREISQTEFQEIVCQMLPFLNTSDLTKAQKMVASTAKSAGVKIKEKNNLLIMTIIPSETRIENPKKEHNSTLIFFHGMGLNNHCVGHFNNHMQEKFPHTKFIFPQASRKEWKVKGMFSSENTNWYCIKTTRDHLFTPNPPKNLEEVEE